MDSAKLLDVTPIMSVYNYYKVGGSLEYQHPTYVTRQADEELYEGLKGGDFYYVLNSRQMGKSSLRVQMMKRLQEEGISCVSIDIATLGSHNLTPDNWYGGIAFELLSSLNLLEKINFNSWWCERQILPPVQRLNQLIRDVILVQIDRKLVIFIDEIDSILKIDFKDDFFAFIRACYNNPEYNRLTFCLLGVAAPSDLIKDKDCTPFNIGHAVELKGFKLPEAQRSLTPGLAQKFENPKQILQDILKWTGGQPFLTQKLCNIIVKKSECAYRGVEYCVNQYILENWESQDEPEHLRTIRDRLFKSKRSRITLLKLYQEILTNGFIIADDSPAQIELRLSGLVVKKNNRITIYNRIYEAVFNQAWINKNLQELVGLPPENKATNHLLIVYDEKGSRGYELDDTEYILGRDRHAQIRIFSRYVSRQHATLKRIQTGDEISYRILDGDFQGNRSRNGLFINKKRCLAHPLQHGDEITFGCEARGVYLQRSKVQNCLEDDSHLQTFPGDIPFDVDIRDSELMVRSTAIDPEPKPEDEKIG